MSDSQHIERAMVRLMALGEGYAGVNDVVSLGVAAVPALEDLLLHTDPSGIFEPRIRAVAALAALGRNDVLVAFLTLDRHIADPIARAGEDAVISSAARALIGVRDEGVLTVLLTVAHRYPFRGVIEALGALEDPRTIPALATALYEDESRRAAMDGLRRFGTPARKAVLSVAICPMEAPETVSSLRARRAAADLLIELGVDEESWRHFDELIKDPDCEVASSACLAALQWAVPHMGARSAGRLREMIPRLRSPQRERAADAVARASAAGEMRD